MATDPGDLVLDPTCGSGTTAYRRRAMGPALDHDRHLARRAGAGPRAYDGRALSLLSSRRHAGGPRKEQEVSGKIPSDAPTHGDIRQGFVYERAPHVTLKSIANNAEIDVIWETFQAKLEPLRKS